VSGVAWEEEQGTDQILVPCLRTADSRAKARPTGSIPRRPQEGESAAGGVKGGKRMEAFSEGPEN
jgi:hypothetical protein